MSASARIERHGMRSVKKMICVIFLGKLEMGCVGSQTLLITVI